MGTRHASAQLQEQLIQKFSKVEVQSPQHFNRAELCPSQSMGICLSCCGVSLSQSTGSSLICLPRKFVAEIDLLLNQVPQARWNRGKGKVGTVASYMTGCKLEFFLLQWVCTCCLNNLRDMHYMAFPFSEVRVPAAVGFCAGAPIPYGMAAH